MGEPLLNLVQVQVAATYLRVAGLATTVSVSTAGIVPRMHDLALHTRTGVNKLFLSLHATTDEVRTQLVPVNKKYNLAQVLEAARFFATITETKVTATYLLFNGINDTDADLERLLHLLDPAMFIIQLSVWNQVDDLAYVASPRLEEFRSVLTNADFAVFIQRSKGSDIDGGCGQLRSRNILMMPVRSTTQRKREA
jgi:23S rRNA (adenine2503-C2)-methyltransferase